MSPNIQLGLGPMEVNRLSGVQETPVKRLDVLRLVLNAFGAIGFRQKEAAASMGISESLFSQQFSHEYPDKHPSLKRMSLGLPESFWRAFALQLCEELGLTVHGADTERHALADVAESMARYLRVIGR